MSVHMIDARYYVLVKGAQDIRPCSRCLKEPAVYLHIVWMVKWPTLGVECFNELFTQVGRGKNPT